MQSGNVDSTEHLSPALQQLRARRRLANFRRFGTSLGASVLFGAAFGASLAAFPLEKTKDSIPILSIQLAVDVFALISIGIMLVSSVQIYLDVGTGIQNWPRIFRDAQNVVDVAAAEQRERRRINVLEGSAPTDIVISPSERHASILRSISAREREETKRWSADNYPFIVRSMVDRLQAEIDQQGGRANLNLGLALAVAVFGVAMLVILSFDINALISKPPAESPHEILFYTGSFASKLALSLSANIFAFFFLATYRRNLSEIRYLHNELTNVQMRTIALYASYENRTGSSTSTILKILGSTERNFILKKGERTADLAVKELDKAETANLATMISEAGKKLRLEEPEQDNA